MNPDLKAKPCPFCGNTIDLTLGDSLHPTGVGYIDSDEGYRYYESIRSREIPKENWCYSVICSELYGGCGAEVAGDDKFEAIQKWNRRV